MKLKTKELDKNQCTASACSQSFRKKVGLFAAVALVWLVFDLATKNYFNSNFEVGEFIAGPFLGLFQFRLIHNTGAAWGIFGDSTAALGVFSLLVCAVLVACFAFFGRRMILGEVVGLALIYAGGFGNAFDRLTLGYVVDFIDLAFMKFPVFNIADIGVTCGLILFFISYLIRDRKESKIIKQELTDLGKNQHKDCSDVLGSDA